MIRRTEFAWTRYTGEDFNVVWSYSSEDGGVSTPVDLTGFGFEVRFPESAGFSTIDGAVTDAANGEITFSIAGAVDVGVAGGTYAAQVWRISPSAEEVHLISGTLAVKEGYLDDYPA